jgi:hypothetical protein
MAIAILAAAEDEHALRIQHVLQESQVFAPIIDSRSFPERMQITYRPSDEGSIRLPAGQELPFEQIHAVYWRNYFGPWGPQLPDPEQTFIAANDSRSLIESVLIRLPVKWVNSWRAFQSHQTKPAQLALLAAQGIPVPKTVVTNDPQAAREFAAQHPRLIFKPVQGGAHAQRLTARHLTEKHLQNLAYAPVTLQEEVIGTSIRVFVVGEHMFACEFDTEALDYRDDPQAQVRSHQLPSEAADICRRAAAALELVWTGIDLQRRKSGEYVLLEANPSPMFLGFEDRTGFPLTACLVELLTT